MSMTKDQINKLRDWLGSEGAIAGLEYSKLTSSELYEIAVSIGCPVERRTKRRDIIIELVNRNDKRLKKTNDELLSMSFEEIKIYIEETCASRTEILDRLAQFGIKPGSEAKKHLIDFMAREISDIGMYERVAKGRNSV